MTVKSCRVVRLLQCVYGVCTRFKDNGLTLQTESPLGWWSWGFFLFSHLFIFHPRLLSLSPSVPLTLVGDRKVCAKVTKEIINHLHTPLTLSKQTNRSEARERARERPHKLSSVLVRWSVSRLFGQLTNACIPFYATGRPAEGRSVELVASRVYAIDGVTRLSHVST